MIECQFLKCEKVKSVKDVRKSRPNVCGLEISPESCIRKTVERNSLKKIRSLED